MPELIRVIGKAYLKDGALFLRTPDATVQLDAKGAQFKEGCVYRVVGSMLESSNVIAVQHSRELEGFDFELYCKASLKAKGASQS